LAEIVKFVLAHTLNYTGDVAKTISDYLNV